MARLPIPFGNPATYPGHSGVDYPQARGTLFRASGPGKVTLRNYNSRAGNMVWVEYDAMPSQNGVAYAHLDNYNDSPPVGTRVVEGTVLGRVGNTGNSTGPHLHSEVNGYATTDGYWKWFDPNRVVQGGGGGGGTPGPSQRQVGANGANGRNDPSTQGPVTQTLPPGTIGDFNGWITGQNVEGNSTWFRGSHSGDFFWSGGFTDTGTHDLANLNPPPVSNQRTVGPNGANGRNDPSTNGPVTQTLAPGTVGDFNGWTNGQNVEGNTVWFRGQHSGDWFWSGGFTSTATAGLPFVEVGPTPPDPPEPGPVDPDNPRNLKEYTPVYPLAVAGLEAPLGFTDCQNPVTRTPRTSGYNPPRPTTGIIDRFIIHYTAVTNDQLDWFSHCNSRSVCPTFYMRTDGTVFEMIRPGTKPAATGPDWNWRSIAVESLCVTPGPEGKQTDAQMEGFAQMIAWLAEFDGKTLDGAPVSFKIDRTHVISHQEALPGTECPGEYIQPRMNAIVERALAIYKENNPDPEPGMVEVPRAVLEGWRAQAWTLFEDIGSFLD